MATARTIIRNALTVHLNRLSPGEAEDADTFGACRDALNLIVDEFNGSKTFLFRETTTTAAVSGLSANLSAWGLAPGSQILGATYSDGGSDTPIAPLTIAQYQDIPVKTTLGVPQVYAHDGLSVVFFYPGATGQSIALRTLAAVADFADLDTAYTLPAGYSSALSALLAEKMAPSMVGGISGDVARAARAARMRLGAQAANPAIVDACAHSTGNILAGWA
jgi:hypothetical protein